MNRTAQDVLTIIGLLMFFCGLALWLHILKNLP